MKPILYGHPDSGHAFKVALALRFAQIDFDFRYVDIWAARETRPQTFLERSPFAEVPLLLIDGKAMTQSGAILLELGQRNPALIGPNPDRARELVFWEANRIGMVIPQLIEEKRVNGEGFGEGALAWLRGRYSSDIARLSDLIGAQDFVLGEAPCIADFAIFGYTNWHERAGVDVPTNVAQWLSRMRALPAYAPPEEIMAA